MYDVVNEIPNIGEKRYIELGIYMGGNRDKVKAKERLSVDTIPDGNPSFLGTTDDYFAQLPADERFDVAYIDACHDYHFVWRDFNNVVDHLNPGGVIICHDMVPVNESNVAPSLSGDAYKLLALIMNVYRDYTNYRVLTTNSGLGVFVDPPKLDRTNHYFYDAVSYSSFMEMLKDCDKTTAEFEDLYAFVRGLA